MKPTKKYLLVFLLFFMAGFAAYAQSIVWDKDIPLVQDQRSYTICPSENKGFWVGGYTFEKPYRYGASVFPKMIVMAVDSVGDTLWQKNYFNHYRIGVIAQILPAPAGKYLVGDYSHDTIVSASVPNARRKPLIMYVDNNGEIIWKVDNLMPACTGLEVAQAKVMDNGDIVIVGMYYLINPQFCTYNYMSFAIRVSPDGVKLWDKTYPQSGDYNRINSIGELPNGDLLFSGARAGNGIMALQVEANKANTYYKPNRHRYGSISAMYFNTTQRWWIYCHRRLCYIERRLRLYGAFRCQSQ